MTTWAEPTEQEALEHLRDVLAAEVEDGWTLPLAFLYPAGDGLGDGPNPVQARHSLAELRDLASAVNAYDHQGFIWPGSVRDALREACRAGFDPYAPED